MTFQVALGGRSTGVLALVTPSLNQEILLSWRTLQRLGVIPMDFPNVADKAVRAKAVVVNPLREWRNTPRYDGLSPAQGLYGRRQRTEAVVIP